MTSPNSIGSAPSFVGKESPTSVQGGEFTRVDRHGAVRPGASSDTGQCCLSELFAGADDDTTAAAAAAAAPGATPVTM